MTRLPSQLVLRWGLVLSLLGPVVRLDESVQHAVQNLRSSPLESVMQAATDTGRHEIVFGVLLGVALFSGPAGPLTAREALFTLLATNLVVEGLKPAVGRVRPDGDRDRRNASFPSGHAASAFAIAVVFARRWRRLGPVFFGFAAIVACFRIYLNRHFMSDVLCGAAIGLACAWAIGRLMSARAGKGKSRAAA